PVGEAVRAIVLDPAMHGLAAETELLLMFASRAQLVREVIEPALAAGRWVLCDRYADASHAYQGGGRGQPPARIAELERWACAGIRPDLAARSASGHRTRTGGRPRRDRSHRDRSRRVLRTGACELSRTCRGRTPAIPGDRCQPAGRRRAAGGHAGIDHLAGGVAGMSALPWHAEHWSRLQARRQRDALAHALLLCGAPGLGKRAFAQRFVQGLLCSDGVDGNACGRCRSCLLVEAGSHPDVIGLSFGLRRDGTPRTEIVVDQIRELSARL